MGDSEILRQLRLDCAIHLGVLSNVANSMIAQMEDGLTVNGRGEIKMLLSYVNTLPTGQENGLFYSLDLGGTNFRVLRVRLNGGRAFSIEKISQGQIPEDRKTGTKEELFSFMASGLSRFLTEEGPEIPRETHREIGFTFSFPVNQTSINVGTLIEWTKGFNIPAAIGQDVVACLNEALTGANLNMCSVTALVNDTVGTLAGARYKNDDVKVAVILGTGTNACYIERTDRIPKMIVQGDIQDPLPEYTIINTEWGAFSDLRVLPVTIFDNELDAESTDSGRQRFMKMISGKYLGIIVSKILLKMAASERLFGQGYTAPEGTEDINNMHSDNPALLGTVQSILHEKLNVGEISLEVRRTVVTVIDTIVERAARLAGAGIVVILQKMGINGETKETTVVAVDGSLYEHYEQYRFHLKEVVTQLIGTNVVIERFPDASGVGAALLAHYH
ncbi:hypothetical protein MKW94_016379 [Papaver nudicaule]|uniref:Phosphotransferase n=1 Tax=Papaver nudicaule TaxID=74823 RepID=A0AA41S040_PAPNU|nr:hypothetical protein [Papaver nudicaule]